MPRVQIDCGLSSMKTAVMDNYLWLKPLLIEYKEILFLLFPLKGEANKAELFN